MQIQVRQAVSSTRSYKAALNLIKKQHAERKAPSRSEMSEFQTSPPAHKDSKGTKEAGASDLEQIKLMEGSAAFFNRFMERTRELENLPEHRARMMRDLQEEETRKGVATQFGRMRFDELGHNR
jgi:hypothetical protein